MRRTATSNRLNQSSFSQLAPLLYEYDAFGNALGNSIVGAMAKQPEQPAKENKGNAVPQSYAKGDKYVDEDGRVGIVSAVDENGQPTTIGYALTELAEQDETFRQWRDDYEVQHAAFLERRGYGKRQQWY